MGQNLARGDWVEPAKQYGDGSGTPSRGKVVGAMGVSADGDPRVAVAWNNSPEIEVWPQSMLKLLKRHGRCKRVAASQSFAPDEVALGVELFNGILRGADPRQYTKNAAFPKLMNKFINMQKRVRALHEQVQGKQQKVS